MSDGRQVIKRGMVPIDRLFDVTATKCTVCGHVGCDCWERCSCGWFARRGEACGNPETTSCSTKVKARNNAAIRRKSKRVHHV